PATAPSSLTEVNKTVTTITVSWTPLDSSDADGYVSSQCHLVTQTLCRQYRWREVVIIQSH
uniref:Fibronectin type-III domain-containing protein n=1 Tax=Amphimedon queenslandica TaxID=400682 RepID=A0A1X7T6A5_AMPQE